MSIHLSVKKLFTLKTFFISFSITLISFNCAIFIKLLFLYYYNKRLHFDSKNMNGKNKRKTDIPSYMTSSQTFPQTSQ